MASYKPFLYSDGALGNLKRARAINSAASNSWLAKKCSNLPLSFSLSMQSIPGKLALFLLVVIAIDCSLEGKSGKLTGPPNPESSASEEPRINFSSSDSANKTLSAMLLIDSDIFRLNGSLHSQGNASVLIFHVLKISMGANIRKPRLFKQ